MESASVARMVVEPLRLPRAEATLELMAWEEGTGQEGTSSGLYLALSTLFRRDYRRHCENVHWGLRRKTGL